MHNIVTKQGIRPPRAHACMHKLHAGTNACMHGNLHAQMHACMLHADFTYISPFRTASSKAPRPGMVVSSTFVPFVPRSPITASVLSPVSSDIVWAASKKLTISPFFK